MKNNYSDFIFRNKKELSALGFIDIFLILGGFFAERHFAIPLWLSAVLLGIIDALLLVVIIKNDRNKRRAVIAGIKDVIMQVDYRKDYRQEFQNLFEEDGEAGIIVAKFLSMLEDNCGIEEIAQYGKSIDPQLDVLFMAVYYAVRVKDCELLDELRDEQKNESFPAYDFLYSLLAVLLVILICLSLPSVFRGFVDGQ